EFAGPADERQPLVIFVGARPLADKHELGLGTAIAKNYFVAALVQLATRAIADVFADLQQRVVFDFVHTLEKRGARRRDDWRDVQRWSDRSRFRRQLPGGGLRQGILLRGGSGQDD